MKILNSSAALNDEYWEKEIGIYSGMQHRNIVQLVGYCQETEEIHVKHKGKMVTASKIYSAGCYEYLQNGSLHKYISGMAL